MLKGRSSCRVCRPIKEDAVWNLVRKAQQPAGDANVDHHHHLKVEAEYEFDVFFSRTGSSYFADCVVDALVKEGIRIFRDDDKRRKVIPEKTVNAIQSSRISVVILSSQYANSEICLRKLCKIVECMETSGLIAVPIFNHVNASHIREQSGGLRKPFKFYEKYRTEEVKSWRDALKRVGDISGWIIPKNFDWQEDKQLAEPVAADISSRLGISEEENVMDPKTYYEKFPFTCNEKYESSSDDEY